MHWHMYEPLLLKQEPLFWHGFDFKHSWISESKPFHHYAYMLIIQFYHSLLMLKEYNYGFSQKHWVMRTLALCLTKENVLCFKLWNVFNLNQRIWHDEFIYHFHNVDPSIQLHMHRHMIHCYWHKIRYFDKELAYTHLHLNVK